MAHGGGTNIVEFKESVVAHEVAHQWWGSLVAMGNRRNYWFVESLAEYSSALYIESLYGRKNPEAGRKAYLDKVDAWRRVVLEAEAMASVQDVDTMWSGGDFPGQARTAAIYNQGPYAFHILRETFGDEKFFAFLKALAQEMQGKEIVTRDIQNVAEQSFGGTMEWFFDQWIRSPGIPQYSFNYTMRQAEDKNWIVEGNIKQRVVLGPDEQVLEDTYYRGIITITVTGVDKQDYPVRILIEEATTPFAFKVPVEPRDVVLNKNLEMLAQKIFVNEDFY
jgi:aminopeptidase N